MEDKKIADDIAEAFHEGWRGGYDAGYQAGKRDAVVVTRRAAGSSEDV